MYRSTLTQVDCDPHSLALHAWFTAYVGSLVCAAQFCVLPLSPSLSLPLSLSLCHYTVSLSPCHCHCVTALCHCTVSLSLCHCTVSLCHCTVSLCHCTVSLCHCTVSLYCVLFVLYDEPPVFWQEDTACRMVQCTAIRCLPLWITWEDTSLHSHLTKWLRWARIN